MTEEPKWFSGYVKTHDLDHGQLENQIEKLEAEIFDQTNKSRIDESLSKYDELEQLIKTEVNTIKQYSGFNRKRMVELEQKIENCITLPELEGNIEAFTERIDTLSAVIKVLITDIMIENISGDAESLEEYHEEKLRYKNLLKQLDGRGEPSKDIWRDFKKDYPLIKEEQEYVSHIDPITLVEVQLKKEAEPVIDYGYKNIFAVDHGVKQGKEIMKEKLIAEFLEKILAFNYARDTAPQIREIREWLEAKLKE